jgi:hypothetical protein
MPLRCGWWSRLSAFQGCGQLSRVRAVFALPPEVLRLLNAFCSVTQAQFPQHASTSAQHEAALFLQPHVFYLMLNNPILHRVVSLHVDSGWGRGALHPQRRYVAKESARVYGSGTLGRPPNLDMPSISSKTSLTGDSPLNSQFLLLSMMNC